LGAEDYLERIRKAKEAVAIPIIGSLNGVSIGGWTAPCLGPVTHAGCGAICPSYNRGCYGCYGPKETPNTASLSAWFGRLRRGELDLVQIYRNFNAWAADFREASEAHEK